MVDGFITHMLKENHALIDILLKNGNVLKKYFSIPVFLKVKYQVCMYVYMCVCMYVCMYVCMWYDVLYVFY